MKTPRLETERLVLREIRATDTSAIFDGWMQDEAVARYMLWDASSEIGAAKEFVELELGQIGNPQWFRWLIFLRGTEQLIGTCLVFFNTEEDPAHWDISYNLGRQYWGQGFALEAMEAAMRFAVERLGMTVCITTLPGKTALRQSFCTSWDFATKRRSPMCAAAVWSPKASAVVLRRNENFEKGSG